MNQEIILETTELKKPHHVGFVSKRRNIVVNLHESTLECHTALELCLSSLRNSGNFFYRKSTIGKRIAAIEANNDT